MIRAETWEGAQTRRSLLKNADFNGMRSDFMNGFGATRDPQALFVELEPGWSIRTHYHLCHQFQIVTDGNGKIGRHELTPFVVHYSTPETGYGPLVSGDKGISYFVLRAAGEQGGYFLPEARDRMRAGLKKQQISAAPPLLSNTATLRSRRELAVDIIIEPQADGLAAWFMRLPPEASTLAPHHGQSGGRFHIVAGGSWHADGQVRPRLATVWSSPADGSLPVSAGADGLELLVLQFPEAALAPALASTGAA